MPDGGVYPPKRYGIAIVATLLAAAVLIALVTPPTNASAGRTLAWLHPGNQDAWKACPRPFYPLHKPLPGFGKGRRVAIVGDSLTKDGYAGMQRQLTRSGYLPTTACWGGNQTEWGHQQLRDIATQVGRLPNTVVVALGTNDVHKNICYTAAACRGVHARYRLKVRALLRYVGPHRHVVWVNTHIRLASALPYFASAGQPEPQLRFYPVFNRILASEIVADRKRSIATRQIIDWDRIVRRYNATHSSPLPMSTDGLHYAAGGTFARLALISAALRSIPA